MTMFDAVDFAGLDNPEIALEHGLIDHEHYKKLKEIESWKITDGRVQ